MSSATSEAKNLENLLSIKDADRFWSKVSKRGDDECWPWLASQVGGTGYGKFTIHHGIHTSAHRASYWFSKGSIPDGLWVLHSCDNKICVNPAHLKIGTREENVAEAVERNRVPHNFGETNGAATLIEDEVRAIRDGYEAGEFTQKELACSYNVSQQLISRIVTRKIWGHLA